MTIYRIQWDTTQPASRVDGGDYIFYFYWRPRLEAWFVDVTDAVGSYVLRGGRISRSCLLGAGSLRFPGTLFTVSLSPARLGDEVLLFWDRP